MTAEPAHQPLDFRDPRAPREGKPPELENFLRAMVKAGASDLHLKAGSPPSIRVQGAIRTVKAEALSPARTAELATEIMSERQRAFFVENGHIDLAMDLENSDRFRINAYRQRGQVSLAIRRVLRQVPTFDALHLPAPVRALAEVRQGLVLLAGPTGSGKSTTIAAILEQINQTRPCHVVTIEDPIEYLHQDKVAIIDQREIAIDVRSYGDALKVLPREDPDVVLIGEMRDPETFQAAMQVVESGHLVLGTIHAPSAAGTIGRILDLFPPDGRDLIRHALAFNLRTVVCQRLLPSLLPDAPRIPAVEILTVTPSARQLILDRREGELHDLVRGGERDGMLPLNRALAQMVEKDQIDPKVAYDASPNPDELKMMLKGISSSHPGILTRITGSNS